MLENLIPFPALVLFAGFLFYMLILRRVTAFSFTLVGLILLEICHQLIRHFVAVLVIDIPSSDIGFYIWYVSFFVTDLMYVFLVSFSAKKMSLKLDNASKTILLLISTLGFIQLFRMIDRLLIDSNITSVLYKQGIPLVNLLISIVVGLVVILSIFNTRNRNH